MHTFLAMSFCVANNIGENNRKLHMNAMLYFVKMPEV
jgi:hypothetical protein